MSIIIGQYLEGLVKDLDLDKDYASKAPIIYVGKSELPEGVLGMYDTIQNVIYLRNDLPEKSHKDYRVVKEHESQHARGKRKEGLIFFNCSNK